MMPLTDSVPNGPASKVAGGSHVSGPVRTNVESGAGGVGAAAGAAAGAAGACAAGAAADATAELDEEPEVWAPATSPAAMAAMAVICRMRITFRFIGTFPPN